MRFRFEVYFSSALPPPSLSRSASVCVFLFRGLLLGNLREAVRDVVGDVEPRDVLTVQQVHRVALLLAEDRHEDVGDADFLLAARLHVKQRPLQHSLETQRRLHLALFGFVDARGGLVDVFLDLLLELREIRATGTEDFANLRSIEDGEQQVLDREVLMTGFTRLVKRIVETVFKLVGQHDSKPSDGDQASSRVHISGCWLSRA
jgi:hypothetical protein